MRVYHYLTLVMLAYLRNITAFVITADSYPAAATALAGVITAADLKRINVPISSTFIPSTATLQAPLSAASTAAPTSTAYVIRRQTQKCFDDRGFQVDCATWTGYYYSWGPPGNPYEGGPGDGQWDGGSGSDGSDGLLFQSMANPFDQVSVIMALGGLFLLLALLL